MILLYIILGALTIIGYILSILMVISMFIYSIVKAIKILLDMKELW